MSCGFRHPYGMETRIEKMEKDIKLIISNQEEILSALEMINGSHQEQGDKTNGKSDN